MIGVPVWVLNIVFILGFVSAVVGTILSPPLRSERRWRDFLSFLLIVVGCVAFGVATGAQSAVNDQSTGPAKPVTVVCSTSGGPIGLVNPGQAMAARFEPVGS